VHSPCCKGGPWSSGDDDGVQAGGHVGRRPTSHESCCLGAEKLINAWRRRVATDGCPARKMKPAVSVSMEFACGQGCPRAPTLPQLSLSSFGGVPTGALEASALLPLAYQPVLESWSLQSTQQSLQADIFVVFSSRIPWQLSSSVSRSPIESESQGLSFFTRSPIEPERKVAVPSSLTGKSQPHRSLRG
jgi:hypothetical protein